MKRRNSRSAHHLAILTYTHSAQTGKTPVTGKFGLQVRPLPLVLPVSNPNANGLRPLSGKSRIFLFSITWPRDDRSNAFGQGQYVRAILNLRHFQAGNGEISELHWRSGGYALPFGPGMRWLSKGLTGRLLGGWQTSGILTLREGFPTNIRTNVIPPIFNTIFGLLVTNTVRKPPFRVQAYPETPFHSGQTLGRRQSGRSAPRIEFVDRSC